MQEEIKRIDKVLSNYPSVYKRWKELIGNGELDEDAYKRAISFFDEEWNKTNEMKVR